MKLQELLPEVTERFKTIPLDRIKAHVEAVKGKGGYKDLETRIVWDCIHNTTTARKICEWYEKYNCNDEHITTLAKQAFKNAFGIAL